MSMYAQGSPQGTLHQEPRVKTEDLFFGETPIFEKMPTFSENFRPFLCEKKNCIRVPTCP